MNEKINTMKTGLKTKDDPNCFDLVAALERLDEEMAATLIYPGKDKIEQTLDATIDGFEKKKPGQTVANLWGKLVEEVKEWEMEHPRITQVVGDIANGLARSGI